MYAYRDNFNSKIWNDNMMSVFVLFLSSGTCSIHNTGVTVTTYIAHAHYTGMYVKNKYMGSNYINLPLSSCLLLPEFSPLWSVSLCTCSSLCLQTVMHESLTQSYTQIHYLYHTYHFPNFRKMKVAHHIWNHYTYIIFWFGVFVNMYTQWSCCSSRKLWCSSK